MSILGAGLAAIALALSGVSQETAPQTSATSILENAPDSVWVTIDPENILVMDLPSGALLIQLQPELAPLHVDRIRTLTRQGFYDGTVFHRVIEGFMAQGGDPTATGTGGSDLPDLPGEFAFDAHARPIGEVIGRDDRAAQIGFVGTVAVGTQAPTLPGLLARDSMAMWGLHCQGVMSMARASNPNSANSQFFLMFGDSRDNLDQGYTVWGKIVDGYRNARRINRGEPPPRPTPIVRMRVMADMPAEEQKTVEYLDPAAPAFKEYLRKTFQVTENGYVRDACGIDVPIRINGELNL